MTWVPFALLILAIIFLLFPYNADTGMLEPDIILIIGVAISVVLGEIIAAVTTKSAARSGEKRIGGECGVTNRCRK